MTRWLRSFPAIAPLLLGVIVAGRASAVDIPGDPSSCGITIERGDPGVLQGDLGCTGLGENSAITLNPGATLVLDGFRVTNDNHGVSCHASVSPARTCTITGPGEITGAFNGVAAASRVRIEDVTIHGNVNGTWKIYGNVPWAARVDLENVVIRDNSAAGTRGGGAIRATDSVIRDNGDVGMTSQGPTTLRRTTITGNVGAGLLTGIYNDFQQQYDYSERRAHRLIDSDVSGNGLIDGNADLVAAKRPKLLRSTCGTSADPTQPGNPSWGVCAGD
ncbi:MAG: hypothetical protein FJ148_11670 [Deltaproteobacteria bacterium]|nr:hypothetical protein [Deltaproteobacteria bacterium]